MPLQELIFVDDASALPGSLDALSDLTTVGVDVERADWNRYYRAAALVQVGGGGRVAVLDPLGIDSFADLEGFLAERTVVLHAMENDLVPLEALGVAPPQVEDTAIAAALLGLPTGLETLLAEVLGISASGDKQAMQRADWEARPLDDAMLAYAAGDVADLPELWARLWEQLVARARDGWYRQELAAARDLPSVEERRDWSRTKGAGRLDVRAKARLRHLWDAREQLAQRTDTAPGRIASDKVLVDLATSPPAAVSELGRRGVRRQAARDFGSDLLAAIAAADASPLEPERPTGGRVTPEHRSLADRLRAIRADRAQALGLDAGVLCPSRTLLSAVASEPSTPEGLADALGLLPWQWEQVGAAFCEALELDGEGKPAPPPSTDDEETTVG
jgi:ribonuclease D